MTGRGKLAKRESRLFLAPLLMVGLILAGKMLREKFLPTDVVSVNVNSAEYATGGLRRLFALLDQAINENPGASTFYVQTSGGINAHAYYNRPDESLSYAGNDLDPITFQSIMHRDYLTFIDDVQTHHYLQHPQELFDNERRHLPRPTPCHAKNLL